MSTIASPNAKFLLFSFLFFANCCISQNLYNKAVTFTTPASWKAGRIFHPTADPPWQQMLDMGHLEWMEGKMPVPSGFILFKLKKEGIAGLKGEVTLPHGMSGVFTWNGHSVELTGAVKQIRFP